MADFPFWDGTEGDAWETVGLGTQVIPGLCEVVWRKPPKRKIEKKTVKGTDGTTVTDQGNELAEMVIRSQLCSAQHWRDYLKIIPYLWTLKDGGKRSPVEIAHPLPNHVNIKDVYIEEWNPAMPDGQIMVLEILVFQWKPNPKPIVQAAGRGEPEPPVPHAGVTAAAAQAEGDSIVAQNLVASTTDALLNNISQYL